ncbi:MAG: phage tail protein [Pseudomonadota bacterium]
MGKAFKVVAAIGVAVAIAALAAPTGGASLGLVSLLGSAGITISATVASAIIATTLSIVAAYAMQALAGRPATARPAPINFRQSMANSWIIIGKRRVGGLMVFFHPRAAFGGQYRYFVFAAAGHRCEGVLRWWLNDEIVTVDPTTGLVTSGKYADAAFLFWDGGADNATAFGRFVVECGGRWTEDHRGRGIAKIYAIFQMTKEVVEAGMPTISAEWQGANEIVDPRTGTAGYTDLAIPAFYWWMRLPREEGGFGISEEEMPDVDLLSAWTNLCDEDVETPDGDEKRYTINALIETGAAPSEIRQTFVTAMAGQFAYVEGKHMLRPGYWNPVSVSLSESDLAGPIELPMMLPGEEVATEVLGSFFDPDVDYQPQPVPTRRIASADIRQMQLDLPHCASPWLGQRIAEIMLRRAQCEKRLTWPMNIMGLGVTAMDSVQVDTARYGLSNYAWVVDQWTMGSDFSVQLGLREENEEIYAPFTYLPRQGIATPDVADPIPDEDVELLKTTVETIDGTVTVVQDTVVTQGDIIAAQGSTIGSQAGLIADLEARVAALETP